jgi:cytoskeletal protein RodZ
MNPVKFSRKTLPQKEGLGEKLAKKRVALGMSSKDVEKAIRIRASFVDDIEAGRYENLPPDVFVRGFLKSYAELLKLDPNKVLRIYKKERGLVENVQKAKAKPPVVRPIEAPKVLVTPKTLMVTSIALVVLVIVGYIGWQVKILTAPPKLSVHNPSNNINVTSDSIAVEGTTDPGAILVINDVEVGVDQNGEFKEKVSLQSGVNTIKVKARNKLGRYTEQSRIVVANIPNIATTTSQPAGIELKVTIGPKSASIQVEIDGRKLTEKPVIVLAGVTQTYKGTEKIIVTTNNAGSVRAVYNGQDVGSFGKDSETVKREFTKGMTIK